ncbi:hypothetical protein BU26DRAFT_127869 [Trematosphaeria pertusa]|uniref:NAD-dependent epimerase/dehydratase domain-containing protein n=1 Tax=Trematosphaeria pertusa TaxID=390896 RepID=A0A6A6HWP7_9PLEO|nr:uncharacterized protein BU26DRAFT_127869 [Trematosphaeria pertusa]KAF2242506.1 hypothetical protein BU26DRAFT_127869 [Trematosphaeria pertusa]
MKVLLTGASGIIGSVILKQCLQRPEITSVITLTRRPLPSTSPKCENIVVRDFKHWDSGLLDDIADADAMIWAMGTSGGNEEPNLNYPLAFQQAFLPTQKSPGKRFRFIQLWRTRRARSEPQSLVPQQRAEDQGPCGNQVCGVCGTA